jgi:hypothetical protein
VAPFNPDPSLVVTSGTGLARQIPISFRGVVLGRDARLGPPFSTDEFVSRSHVWVRRRGDGVEVTDLGSANGTYVNGTRVRAPTLMRDSDVLRIGQIHLKLAALGERDLPVATTRESACMPAPGQRGRLDPGPPQRGLARAGLALDGQRGGRSPDLLGEVTDPVPFGRPDEIAAIRSHTHIPPHPGCAEETSRGVSPARSGLPVVRGRGG